MTIRIAVLVLIAITLVTGLVPAQDEPARVAGHRERIECMNHLRQIGGLLAAMRGAGTAKPLPGPAYLLQVAPKVADSQLGVFVCSGDFEGGYEVRSAPFRKLYRDDWKTAPCSYRGPDQERLDSFAKRPHVPVILACDANGPDGTTPHHPDGVCVLWSTHRVQFLKWADIEGSGGEPCAVGPGSPDPRLRHLVVRSEVAGEEASGNDAHIINELRSEMERLKEEHQQGLAELRAEVEQLKEEVQKLSEKLALVTGMKPPPPAPKVSKLDALVTSVDRETGLILLSIGSKSGVNKGMEFTVYRGNQYIGKVIVNDVKADLCTAISVKELERMAIRTGDKATTRF